MPNIKPISDLRNYTAVINEVTYGNKESLYRLMQMVGWER